MTMMVDYCSSYAPYASSTMSMETSSDSFASRSNRIRTIRLMRPNHGTLPPPNFTCRHGPSLGFSLRGGREHGTGFFVSYVEPSSEAHRQGLRVGDQIIRVNGFTVEDAVHKEVLQLISNHTHLTLKVRRVGMIPVKEKKTDSLSWQIITDMNNMRLSPSLSEKIHDVRMSIMVSPRSKLGCGICKGPDWKPGIFVQFTKDGGIARGAGLRPGDQILTCNNVDFTDISFNEAVDVMKMSRQLDLIVRKNAGADLFPNESSGYNSSASSVTGDQSPSWSDSKRLSIVKEENLDFEDRLDRLPKWNSIEWDLEPAEEREKPYFKPTIINLSEHGTIISNNGSEECQIIENDYGTLGKQKNHVNTFNRTSAEVQKMKTVVVDVHRSDVEETNFSSENGSNSSYYEDIEPRGSGNGNSSSKNSPVSTSLSLSSALSMEIQKRNEKKLLESKPSIDEQLQTKKTAHNNVNVQGFDKMSQHSKLMDEFKQAHKKMFKTNDAEEQYNSDRIANNNNNNNDDDGDDDDSTDSSQKLSERLTNLQAQENTYSTNTMNRKHVNNLPPPPPPPPQDEHVLKKPVANGMKSKAAKGRAPPVPQKRSTLSYNQPPPCPTPDYDTISITSSSSSSVLPAPKQYDPVEMESLESFVLYSPNGNLPKRPPDIYFSNTPTPVNNGSISSNSSTLKKRPVSITIGEYNNGGTIRKQPGKFDFLQNGSSDETDSKTANQSITSQLANELAQTLNRSNLRRKTESMENLLSPSDRHTFKENARKTSTNNSISSILSRNLAKSTSDLSTTSSTETLTNNNSNLLANRITINVNNKMQDMRNRDNKNGILKSPATNHHHKSPLVAQKSITFGEIPTVINDQPLYITT